MQMTHITATVTPQKAYGNILINLDTSSTGCRDFLAPSPVISSASSPIWASVAEAIFCLCDSFLSSVCPSEVVDANDELWEALATDGKACSGTSIETDRPDFLARRVAFAGILMPAGMGTAPSGTSEPWGTATIFPCPAFTAAAQQHTTASARHRRLI
eukprot:CAMPEP_0173127128 /NCGR_PEP_ID=MMETSP1102-20130122/57590_1 /TAXON_ID=49646 /ORGANISM="Geminigera sp., Strain Caron Lab Isolate" /LENGTH=157 /DNA_ID=CAMNT_0014036653 /DNA_START=405 /DNA_END=875 /DNA_ORIENTATION=-